MSFLSGLSDAAAAVLKVLLPSTTKVVIAGKTVTAAQIETSTGTVSAFLTAMQVAIKTKNYPSEAELTVEELLTIATDLGIGEPYVGIAKILFPIIFNEAETIIKTPLIAIDDGRGGFVTQTWINDPRHVENPDGTFKN